VETCPYQNAALHSPLKTEVLAQYHLNGKKHNSLNSFKRIQCHSCYQAWRKKRSLKQLLPFLRMFQPTRIEESWIVSPGTNLFDKNMLPRSD